MEVVSAWTRAAERGSLYETEWNLRRRDGEYRCLSIRAAPVRSANGEVREWIGCNIDITDHQQRHDELRRRHATADATMAQLKRQARDMQILKNLSDTLQACNSREEAYPFIALAATELFPGARGALAVPAMGVREMLATAIDWGEDCRDKGEWMKVDFALDDCWALRRGAMHEPGVGTVCQHFVTGSGSPHACIPLSVRGEVSGLLSVRFPEPPPRMDEERRATLSTFGNAVALGLSTLRLRETSREITTPGQ
jgi:GAF domain-containing protein